MRKKIKGFQRAKLLFSGHTYTHIHAWLSNHRAWHRMAIWGLHHHQILKESQLSCDSTAFSAHQDRSSRTGLSTDTLISDCCTECEQTSVGSPFSTLD